MARKKQEVKTGGLKDPCHHDTYKDLQRKAIMYGMPFPDVPASGVFDLIRFINRSDNPEPNPELIKRYDEWVLKQLDLSGVPEKDPLRNSRLRLSFIEDKDENGNVLKKRSLTLRKNEAKKPPKERDEFNLVKGTKKSYTWELTKKGYDIERIIRRVLKKFPDANDKSIRLWNRACLRDIKKNGKN